MKADTVLVNGRIYSGIHPHPFDYLAVGKNKVLDTGKGTGKQHIGKKTTVIDLRGKSVTAGIIDSHLHLLDYAWSLSRIHFHDCSSEQQVLSKLRERAATTVPGEWILGRSWTKTHFHGFPHRSLLDEIFPHNPVALNSHDGHFLWVNSIALKIAGLEHPPSISGGYVGSDSSGSLTGILGENAVQLMTPYIAKPDKTSRKNSLLTAQHALHLLGITGLHSTDGNQAFGDLQELHAEGKLRLRIFHSIPLHQLEDAVRLSLKTGLGDSWFRFGFVKIFCDGALGSQSALMLEPYHETGGLGMETISEEELTEKIHLAVVNGIAVGVHAIGDRANRQVLNAFERNMHFLKIPRAKSRIEHAQLLHPNDIPRFGHIGVVASMQPYHAVSDCELAERYWGQRADYSYAWRSLLDSGAILIFGSDAPVESPDPMQGFHAAVHRSNWKNRSQVISPHETLLAYTKYAALASGEERARGTLEPGKLADFVIFSEDPVESGFLGIQVLATAVEGEFVYRDFE